MQDTLDILQTDDFIEHHGVKGMHWGVRKQQYKQNVKSIKQKYKKANKEIRKQRSKDVKKYLTSFTGLRKGIYALENVEGHTDKIAVNMFKRSQELKRAKSTLYKDINKKKSDKYLKKANEQFIQTYYNRIVMKKPDGTFHITRFYSN